MECSSLSLSIFPMNPMAFFCPLISEYVTLTLFSSVLVIPFQVFLYICYFSCLKYNLIVRRHSFSFAFHLNLISFNLTVTISGFAKATNGRSNIPTAITIRQHHITGIAQIQTQNLPNLSFILLSFRAILHFPSCLLFLLKA